MKKNYRQLASSGSITDEQINDMIEAILATEKAGGHTQ
jgi:hypothetical protein